MTTKIKRKKLDVLKELIKKFEKVQEDCSDFGAGDTEPDGEFQHMLACAVKGKETKVKLTANEWQLYSIKGASGAAAKLSNAAAKVVRCIKTCTVADLVEVRPYLESYCWRADF